MELSSPELESVVLAPFERVYSDGGWHRATVALAENTALLVIDGYPMETRRLLSFTTGVDYLFAGQPAGLGLPGRAVFTGEGCICWGRAVFAGEGCVSWGRAIFAGRKDCICEAGRSPFT